MIFKPSLMDRKYPFWSNLVPKNQNCLLKMKVFTNSKLKKLNLIVTLIWPDLDMKYPF